MKQKIVRRASALVLAGCLLAGAALPAFAASAKEEVIYANLDASGTVTGMYAVNSFAVQADPGVLRAGHRDLGVGVGLQILVYVLLAVGAEPQLAVQLTGEHEGTALGLAVTANGGQILHGVGIQEFNDFVQRHGLVPPGLLHWVCGASRRAPADEAMIHPFLPGVKYAQCGNLVTGG